MKLSLEIKKSIENPSEIQEFIKNLKNFQLQINILNIIVDENLKKEEWMEIHQILQEDDKYFKFSIDDDDFTFKRQQELPFINYYQTLVEYQKKIKREIELTKIIDSIENFINKSTITIDKYKQQKDIFILGDNDELIKQIDDSIVQINNILSEKYVQRIKSRVEKVQMVILYYSQFIELWTNCQINWIYLEPIFNGGDMMKDLTKETKQFNKEIHQPLIKFIKETNDDQSKLKKKIRQCDSKMINDFKKYLLELE